MAEVSTPGKTSMPDDGCQKDFSLTELAGRMVRETHPVYGDGSGLEAVREAVADGLPADAVKQLQAELKRFGVRRASEYVNGIVPRATLQRRERLKQDEGETVLRVASVVALAVYVGGSDQWAAEWLTCRHPMLGGAHPIDRALSAVGARQVEHILYSLHFGLPA